MTSRTLSPGLAAGTPRAARAVLRMLASLRVGTLDLQMPDGTQAHFGVHREGEPHAALRVRDWRVFGAALRSGDIGFAEGFITGGWTSPHLVDLLTLFIANRDAMEALIHGRWWGSLLHRCRHLLRRNSPRGSRRNVQAHYDLGNAFYRLWLDETMNYSSALFDGDLARDAASAQRAKIRRALSACALRPGDRLLEIGCGWGALAEVAAAERDARVVGITLSAEQLAFARERVQRAALADRVELRLQDYRDVADEPFDAIVSIEMFEAVGRAYWRDFFATVHARLKPGGLACIQSITIRDDLFDRYVRSTDFVQQYIFPGGLLPSVAAFRVEAAAAGLEIVDEFRFGADYAETLRRWRMAFLDRDAQVRRLGFDTRFMRIWEFYLAYCEAAFVTGNTDVVQFTLRRP